MEPGKASSRRCAIYTRKSSEEGLEQDFNSLHAQREACESYIKSQQGEGWRLVKTAYDDGGLSGATMNRPALQRLLSDIRERLIDVVVVYKVDRLTRSLADFAKMVEIFDAQGVSFVAVTQQFNTTTSMGRLTLNVLLSFAQFEREVTGERIRDKIAASKQKGMWMGGFVPLGYDVCDRRIVIDQGEAETVRYIFRRYRELGCVRLLKEDLTAEGSFPSGELPRIVSSQAAARSRGVHFTRCSRIRFTSVRSVTKASAIPVSTKRSWIEQCGSERSSSSVSIGFEARAAKPASKRVLSLGACSMRMAMGLRPVTRAKENASTATTSRATSQPKDLRHRASAGVCLRAS